MTSSKRGFSMVELMVVIAIIAILAGVLFASFGNATESSRAALCLTNMRSLAMTVNSIAMGQGGYPLAGSREVYGMSTGDNTALGYHSQRGWITWLGENYKGSPAHRSNPLYPFYGTANMEENEFAFTNGILWASCGRNRTLYTCPEHALKRKTQKKKAPYFSYVMSAKFGWDYTMGQGPVEGTPDIEYEIGFGDLAIADKTLLFAELPDPSDGEDPEKSAYRSDCTLQYLDVKTAGNSGGDRMAVQAGNAEAIGFLHKVGKRKCAHVAFADGHTEKLVWNPGGVDMKTLTAYLCKGWDVTTSAGTGWQLAKDADMPGEEEEEED